MSRKASNFSALHSKKFIFGSGDASTKNLNKSRRTVKENEFTVTGKGKLLVFNNCSGEASFNEWENTGGTLLGNKSIGCGINSLCFLGIFTKELGQHLVRNILPTGTTFLEMMYYLTEISNTKVILTEHNFNIKTQQDLTNVLNAIYETMPENTCTVVKLNRPGGVLGHSVVFSRENNQLYTIDPQDVKMWKRQDDSKLFNAWQNQRYLSLSVIFNSYPSNVSLRVNNASPTYSIANFPKINEIKMLQWRLNTKRNWKCLAGNTGYNWDCALNAMNYVDVIERKYAEKYSSVFNLIRQGLPLEKIRKELDKTKEPKTFNIFKYYNSLDSLIMTLNNDLLATNGTILLADSSRSRVGHALVVEKDINKKLIIIDPQQETVYSKYDDCVTEYFECHDHYDSWILIYKTGITERSTAFTLKTMPIDPKGSPLSPNISSYMSKVKDKRRSKTRTNRQRKFTYLEPVDQAIPVNSKYISKNKTKRMSQLTENRRKTFNFTPPIISSAPMELEISSGNLVKPA